MEITKYLVNTLKKHSESSLNNDQIMFNELKELKNTKHTETETTNFNINSYLKMIALSIITNLIVGSISNYILGIIWWFF